MDDGLINILVQQTSTRLSERGRWIPDRDVAFRAHMEHAIVPSMWELAIGELVQRQ
jgi:hypothetical protein